MTMQFSDLYTVDFALSEIQLFLVRPPEKGRVLVQRGRTNSALVLSVGGRYAYRYEENGHPSALELAEGGLLYLPRNAAYQHTYLGGMTPTAFEAVGHPVTTIVMYFQLSDEAGAPLEMSKTPLLLPLDGAAYRRALEKLAAMALDRQTQPSEIKARAYSLLSEIIRALCAHARKNRHSDALSPALALADKAPPASLAVEDLIRASYLSPTRFRVLFRETMGMSPHEYLVKTTLESACRLLRGTDLSLSEIAESLGFASASYFGKYFRKYTGTSPGKWRRRTENARQSDALEDGGR